MKLGFKFFLLILLMHFSSNLCERVSIIGSHLTSDSSYKVYLLSHGVDPSLAVNISLKNDKTSKSKRVNSFNMSPNEIEFSDLNFEKAELKVEAKNNEICRKQSVNVINTSDQKLIFIQFNKPIYKTGDTFEFRVFVLDQKLIPMPEYKIQSITVFDSKNNIVERFSDATTQDYGFFEESVEIADDPNTGNWTIHVEVGSKKVTKTFKVQKYSEGDIEVFINAPSAIAVDDRRIYMNIYAKNKDDDFVNGKAVISFTGRFLESSKANIENDNLRNVDLKLGKASVVLDFENDLNIKFLTADMILKFEFMVTDKASHRSKTVTKEVKLRHKGKHDIQVIRKTYFKPTFKFPMKIRVKLLDGKLDNSFNQLSMTTTYMNEQRKIDEKSFQINLKNGETIQVLNPTKETTEIIVNLEFGGTKSTEKIKVFPNFGIKSLPYMQVSVLTKNPKSGDQVKLSVNATEEMEDLHLLVFGLKGLIHSDDFTDSAGKDTFEISFQLTDDMKPEVRGLVFYVDPQSGVIVYDEFSISLGLTVDNSINLTTDETKLKIKTEVGSKVFYSAIDSIADLISSNYEISRTDVYNELIYYLNQKYPSKSGYHFEKLNAFILEPLIYGNDCTSIESSEDKKDNAGENEVQSYFPKVQFSDSFVAELTEFKEIPMKFLNNFPPSKIFGLSVHKEKGFTVSKQESEVKSKNDKFVQIEAPSFMHPNEIVRIRVSTFDAQNNILNGNLTVKIENGRFMDQQKHDTIVNCLLFSNSTEKYKIKKLSQQNSIENFLVQSSSEKLEPIIITAIVKIGSSEYKTQKSVQVKRREDETAFASYLLDINNRKKNFNRNDFPYFKDKPAHITVFGNLFGPAINGLKEIFGRPMTLDEEKVSNLAAAITIQKFNMLYNKDDTNVLIDIKKGFQEVLNVLSNINDTNRAEHLRLAAFAVENLIDGNYTDKNLIIRALDFIAKSGKSNGEFTYNSNLNLRRDIDPGASESKVQSALIIRPFIKYGDSKYSKIIDQTLNFLKKDKEKLSIYAKSVVAYTFALNNDSRIAGELIEINNNNDNKPKDYTMFFEMYSYAILTKILLNEDAKKYVELLIEHRNVNGGFNTPYDTALALKALYEYTNLKDISKSKLTFSVDNGESYEVDHFESKTVKLLRNTDEVKISNSDESGQFIGYMNYFHTELTLVSRTTVEVEDDTDKNGIFKSEIKFKILIKATLMTVKMDIPMGHKFKNYDKPKDQKYKIRNYELVNDQSMVIFYLDNIETNKKHTLTIECEKVFDFYETKSFRISVYDYYRPNMQKVAERIQDFNAAACQKVK